MRFIFFIFFIGSAIFSRNYDKILDRMDELKRRAEMSAIESPLFTKKKRVEIIPTGGTITSDPYMDIYLYGVSLRYHFTEAFGVEAAYYMASSKSTSVTDYMNSQGFSDKPVASEVKSLSNFNLILTPIYSKVSVLSNFILHYDMFFTGGIGSIVTEAETMFNYNYGVGFKIYLSKLIAGNIEIRDFVHKEKQQSQNVTKHNVSLLFGLSVFLF